MPLWAPCRATSRPAHCKEQHCFVLMVKGSFLNSCLAQSCEGMKLYVRATLEAPGNDSSDGVSGLEIKANCWLAVLRASLHQ